MRTSPEDGNKTEAGLARIEAAKRNGTWTALDRIDSGLETPGDLSEALAAERGLREKYDALSKTRKKQYLFYVDSARRPETRKRRVAEAVDRIRAGRHFVI